MFDVDLGKLVDELLSEKIIDSDSEDEIRQSLEDYPIGELHIRAGVFFAVGIPVGAIEAAMTGGAGLVCLPLPGIAIAVAYAADCLYHKLKERINGDSGHGGYDLYRFRADTFAVCIPAGAFGYLGINYKNIHDSLVGRPKARDFLRYSALVNYAEFRQKMLEMKDKLPDYHLVDKPWFRNFLDSRLGRYYQGVRAWNGDRKKAWNERIAALEKRIFGITTDIDIYGFERIRYAREIFSAKT
ncbi:MAG: hypothetical protein HGA85_00315 [Nanoarchaeota archaeon]|nr:hypothetical protein [Nanoarchaeota archaeon]